MWGLALSNVLFEELTWTSTELLRLTSWTLVGLTLLTSVHTALKKVRKHMAGYGAVAYVIIVIIFCFAMFRHLYVLVRPVSGFGYFPDAEVLTSCLAVQKIGPIHILGVQFVCNTMLFTPLLLLPPVPMAATIVVQKMESAIGNHWISRLADKLKSGGAMVASLYLLICAFTLSHTVAVYYFSKEHQEHLVELEAHSNSWLKEKIDDLGQMVGYDVPAMPSGLNTTVTPMAHLEADNILPAMMAFLYLILAWAKLIIVYERLTNRVFEEDFPVVVLTKAFPCFMSMRTFVGDYAAAANKLGKLKEFSGKAYTLLVLSPKYIKQTRDYVNQGFDLVDEAIAMAQADLVAKAAPVTNEFIEEALLHFQTAADDAICKAVNEFQEAMSGLRSLPDASAVQKSAGPPGPATPLMCGNAPATAGASRGVADARAYSPAQLAAFYLQSRQFLDALGIPAADREYVLPGEDAFTDHVLKTARQFLDLFVEEALAKGEQYGDAAATWAIESMANEIRDTAYEIKLSILQPIQTFLKELTYISKQSETYAGAAGKYYKQAAKALEDLQEDFEEVREQAQRLVDMTSGLSFVKKSAWAWAYYALGLFLFVFMTNFTMGTFGAVIQFEWTLLQKVGVVLLFFPFAALFGFMLYFWFMAFAGEVFTSRRSRWVRGARVQSQYVGLEAHGAGKDLWEHSLIVLPALVFVLAVVVLVGQLISAIRSPAWERCRDLAADNESLALTFWQ